MAVPALPEEVAAACQGEAQAAAAGAPEEGHRPQLRDSDCIPVKANDEEAADSVKGPLSDASTDASSSSEQSDTEQSSPEEEAESESECGGDGGEHRFTAEETLIIFDWDDTILPSTWVRRSGLRLEDTVPLPPQHQRELAEMAEYAAATLLLAKKCGTVVLVTNAEEGWIELSCRRFMPSLYPLLMETRLVSARTTYERLDLPNPLDWKVLAFETELARAFQFEGGRCTRKNVLSLGDSLHEREAAIRTTAGLQGCRTKTLKFIERPSLDEVRRQHALVASSFEHLVQQDNNLDLCVTLP